ncbi:hypothetical protein [Helicobacter sp.]|uniref:hypothetical protein n=1 Tax=Helicobacter sp. TaxID=218 RepID=UPI0025BC1F5C|nr:hypothetical protein [Helicobacter sp.]MCI5968165.1 hypothetical protein [Helicobacter sp.]
MLKLLTLYHKNSKSTENRKYFNETSPNIYESNAHIGSGILGGSIAGFSQNEKGELEFNPQNFLLGLTGGAIGSKAIAQFKAKQESRV